MVKVRVKRGGAEVLPFMNDYLTSHTHNMFRYHIANTSITLKTGYLRASYDSERFTMLRPTRIIMCN